MGRSSRRPQPPRAVDHQLLHDPPPPKLPPPPENPPLLLLLHPPPELDPPPPAKPASPGCRALYSYVRGDNRPGLRAASRWQVPVGELGYVRVRRVGSWIVSRSDADRSRTATWPDLGEGTLA